MVSCTSLQYALWSHSLYTSLRNTSMKGIFLLFMTKDGALWMWSSKTPTTGACSNGQELQRHTLAHYFHLGVVT